MLVMMFIYYVQSLSSSGVSYKSQPSHSIITPVASEDIVSVKHHGNTVPCFIE